MIESVNAIPGTTPEPTEASGLGQLGTDAFLKLLVAQLKYQNPMAPSDGTAMLQQTAQFTTVETLKQISEANQRLMGFQQVTMALTVVGQEVTAVGLDGEFLSGTVEGVRFTADGPLLRLDSNAEVPMDNVLSVSAPADEPVSVSAPPPDPAEPPPAPPVSEDVAPEETPAGASAP